MNDFEGKEIRINDEVIYLKRLRTGSSSTRKIMFKGIVKDFKKNKVVIKCTYGREYINQVGKETDIFSHDIYVI